MSERIFKTTPEMRFFGVLPLTKEERDNVLRQQGCENCHLCNEWKPPFHKTEFRTYLHTTDYKFVNGEWEYVGDGSDDGEPDGEVFTCKECYESRD